MRRDEAAVLLALAGARTGDRVAEVGAVGVVRAALQAAAGVPLVGVDAQVVVAGAAHDVATAVRLLADGGRLVARAADPGAAARTAAVHGLRVRLVVPLADGVAWAATRPLPT